MADKDNQKAQQKKAEEKKTAEREKKNAEEKVKKGRPQDEMNDEVLVRILIYDIPGSRNIYSGLTRVKGVSWTVANAVCLKLGLPKTKKISELTKDEIKKIEDFLKNPDLKDYMKNRRKDFETGTTKHLVGTELDIRKDFDIRRLKKIRSYKGVRHTQGQPVRGQRTRSHFRTKGRKAVGVKTKGSK